MCYTLQRHQTLQKGHYYYYYSLYRIGIMYPLSVLKTIEFSITEIFCRTKLFANIDNTLLIFQIHYT